MKKAAFLVLAAQILPFVSVALPEGDALLYPSRTAYIGVNLGGGSTEWKYLVDTTDLPGASTGSVPVDVNEGGPSWGVVFGYDVNKNFAIELQYMRFADSNITFDELGYDTYGYYNFISRTDAYSLSGKFLVPVGTVPTRLRVFAAVGAGMVERHDAVLLNTMTARMLSCITPYLSAGANYSFTRHWMLESGFQYYTGFGVSEVNPVNDFIPFAWDAYARVAYQF